MKKTKKAGSVGAVCLGLLDELEPGLAKKIQIGFRLDVVTFEMVEKNGSELLKIHFMPSKARSFLRWVEKNGLCDN